MKLGDALLVLARLLVARSHLRGRRDDSLSSSRRPAAGGDARPRSDRDRVEIAAQVEQPLRRRDVKTASVAPPSEFDVAVARDADDP